MKKITILRASIFVVLLLLIAPAFAARVTTGQLVIGWEGYAISAAMISVFASLLLLLLSRLLQLPQLETTFKAEIVFAASTVFLVIVLILFVDMAHEIFIGDPSHAGLAGYLLKGSYGTKDPIRLSGDNELADVVLLYVSPLAECGRSFTRTLYTISLPTEGASTLYQELFMSEQATGGGIKPVTSIIKQTTKLLDFYMLAYFLVVHFLLFLKNYGLFFLSIGVVLRAFPPTRGAGAYLMAISIGLYFVFPFIFIFASALSATQMNGLVSVKQGADPNAPPEFACNLPPPPPIPGTCGLQYQNKQKEYQVWLDAYGDRADNLISVVWPSFQRLLVSNFCLIPLVAMVGTLTFVLSTTSLFGGSIPEIGRGLIKLI